MMNCISKKSSKTRTALCLTFLALSTITYKGSKANPPVTLSPSNTAIIFDIDDVILRKTASIPGAMWKHKWGLAKGSISPTLYYKVAILLAEGAPGEKYRKLFSQDYPGLAKLVDEIALSKEPIQETVAIIERLYVLGYPLHIASNMGKEDFAHFQQKYPALFNRFKTAKVVTYTPNEESVKKPNPTYFKDLQNEINENENERKHIIFIDDSNKNVEAARKEGIISLLFTEATQLEKNLCTLGVFDQTGK